MYIPELLLEPKEVEPKVCGICKFCREDIYEGEDYVEYNEDTYHLDCFQDTAASILFDFYGAKIKCE